MKIILTERRLKESDKRLKSVSIEKEQKFKVWTSEGQRDNELEEEQPYSTLQLMARKEHGSTMKEWLSLTKQS